jgi:hypothetical protein
MNRSGRKRWIYQYIMENRRNRKLKHAEKKGMPVEGTGKKPNLGSFRDGAGGNSGVMGSSKELSYRYADEGDKGPEYRREIRRAERTRWLNEWQDEQDSELREMETWEMAYDSFE